MQGPKFSRNSYLVPYGILINKKKGWEGQKMQKEYQPFRAKLEAVLGSHVSGSQV